MKEKSVLEMRGIYKSFPGVRALQNVDFTLEEGEIHALMGENGAGKSTLIKVLTGVYEKDEGQIFLKGLNKPAVIHSPQDAQNLGISTVYQEITLCPNLTVAENMYIGRTKGFGTNWRKMNAGATKILKELDIPAEATQQLSSYSIAIQQMVAIARAVDMDCKVLILDEPTSSLDDSEVEKLFKMMRDLKAKGVGIIFVTHFLEQVYAVCDKITVLRDGQLVGQYEIENLPRIQLVAKMLGKELDDEEEIKDDSLVYQGADADQNVFEAEGLQSNAGIKPFNFHIKKGEVNGFAGLLGSGRSECVRAIFGADKVIAGKVKVKGKDVKISKPIDAMKLGIAYLSESRKDDGLVGDLSVRDNIILAQQVIIQSFKSKHCIGRIRLVRTEIFHSEVIHVHKLIEILVVLGRVLFILQFPFHDLHSRSVCPQLCFRTFFYHRFPRQISISEIPCFNILIVHAQIVQTVYTVLTVSILGSVFHTFLRKHRDGAHS